MNKTTIRKVMQELAKRSNKAQKSKYKDYSAEMSRRARMRKKLSTGAI